MSFNMPLEYVAAAILFTNLCTAAVIVLLLYAKGYLGRKPPRAAVRPAVAPAETVPSASGVEDVVRARIDAETQVAKTLQTLKMQTQMLESGLQATKAG